MRALCLAILFGLAWSGRSRTRAQTIAGKWRPPWLFWLWRTRARRVALPPATGTWPKACTAISTTPLSPPTGNGVPGTLSRRYEVPASG